MWFWYLSLFLLGAAFVYAGNLIVQRKISLKWYDWVIGISGLLILGFAVNNTVGTYIEGYSKASAMFMLVFGIPGLALIGIAVISAWRRQRAIRQT